MAGSKLNWSLAVPCVLMVLGALSPQPAQASGLGRTGRWLTYDGQHPYFVGVDCQQLACDPKLDYVHDLDLLAKYRINKVRIWIYCYWGGAAYLHPWKYDHATGKFDLDTWDPQYWRRVRDFVAQARKRRIVVEVDIFGPNDVRGKANWSNPDWRNAWNANYNINGVFAADDDGDFWPEFFLLDYAPKSKSGKRLVGYQQALLDKTVAELGGYDNVYFEVCNEFPIAWAGNSDAIDKLYPWQIHWVQRLKSETSRLIACHAQQGSGQQTLGVQHFWKDPDIDVLNFHFYTGNPAVLSAVLHRVQGHGKVIFENESFPWQGWGDEHPTKLDQDTREAWGMFLCGGYYGFYHETPMIDHMGDANWREGATRAKVLRDLAERVRFWEMSPVDPAGREYDDLITAGPTGNRRQVLAQPGKQYVAYFWGEGSATPVSMALPGGSYRYDWYDPRDGHRLGGGTVKVPKTVGGGVMTMIAAPMPSSWDAATGLVLIALKQ